MSEAGQSGRVVETRLVGEDEGEVRLDRWFKRHYPQLSHIQLQKLLRTGQVRVDGKRAEANTRLAPGQAIRVPPLPDPAPAAEGAKPAVRKPVFSEKEAQGLRSRVLYRDADVLVLDKPAGLAVQGGTNQDKHLDAMLDLLVLDGKERPKLVHRLDKDTSGCLVLARSSAAASKLAAAFRSRDARKIYWAVTVGVPTPHQGRIDLPLGKEASSGGERMAVDEDGQHAITYYTVLEHAHRQAAFVALWPRTGRTHQLRVHMDALGTPILGDGKYAGQGAFLEGGAEIRRQLHLHARRIIMPHPRGGTIDVTAPLPEHMRPAWDYFGFSTNLKADPFAELQF